MTNTERKEPRNSFGRETRNGTHVKVDLTVKCVRFAIDSEGVSKVAL